MPHSKMLDSLVMQDLSSKLNFRVGLFYTKVRVSVYVCFALYCVVVKSELGDIWGTEDQVTVFKGVLNDSVEPDCKS